MSLKKIVILLPDGISLRNFAYSSFVEKGETLGWDITFLNQTSFNLSQLGYKELELKGNPRPITDLIKRAKILAELDYFTEKFKDPVYQSYKFPAAKNGLKSTVKNAIVSFLVATNRGRKGIKRLRKMLLKAEKDSLFYKKSKVLLAQLNPDLVFCTSQRPVSAIAPLLAAQHLGIKTACFIFSWDNLPKATKVVDTDYYLVWSDFMKREIMTYYADIESKQIKISGSPQFEVHFKEEINLAEDLFYKQYNLIAHKRYLCYSGDDITTAPHDEYYLRDVAEAVRKLNAKGENIGVIFRRCPVDFSVRYDRVLQEYDDVIVAIDPLWKKQGNAWNSILPTPEDLELQSNIIQHTFMVINVASSMVFDYVSYGKPCLYINYNPKGIALQKDTLSIYKYVHFRSMPSQNAVLWCNAKEEIAKKVKEVLNHKTDIVVEEATNWFKVINEHPAGICINRMWKAIEEITQ